MARPAPSSPLGYVVRGQYSERLAIRRLLLRERLHTASNLYRKDLLAHYGCVNAIEFSGRGELLVSGGDDRRVLIWNVEQAVHGVCKPSAMTAQHSSNIFCLGFDSINSKVFSAGNDDQVIVHDAVTGDPVDYFIHEQPVYSLSIHPLNDSVFASACDDGRILIYDIREPISTEPFCLASYTFPFHGVMFNPVEPRIVTTANSKEGVGLWDVRKPLQPLLRYGEQNPAQSCMSVRFNQRGTHILALRRRLPPVVYAMHSSTHMCQFDHPGYYNSCTMKSCCFAGEDDQYVLSGSDDFNLYVWKLPASDENEQWVGCAHMILRGHRSIVNQVRFNPTNYIVASSGVEKLIKFWSPFPLPDATGSLMKEVDASDNQRKVFTHEEYIGLVLRSGQFMTHDYSHQSTKEDPRMMAFFDSLVQREIEGWSSEESGTSDHSTGRELQATDSESELPVTGLGPSLLDTLDGHSTNSASDGNARQPAESQNRISLLIAQKRAQLMRLARSRTGEEDVPDSSRTLRKRLSVRISESSDSGPEEEEEAALDGEEEEEEDEEEEEEAGEGRDGPGTSLVRSSKGTDRNPRKRKITYMVSCGASSEDDADEEEDEEWRPTYKRKKLWGTWRTRDSDSDDIASDDGGASRCSVAKRSGTGSASPPTAAPPPPPPPPPSSQRHARSSRKHTKHLAKMLADLSGSRLRRTSDDKVPSDGTQVEEEEEEEVEEAEEEGEEALLKVECVDESAVPGTPGSGKQYNGGASEEQETPDSGIAVPGSPYSGSSSSSGADWRILRRLHGQVKRTRRNYRKYVAESDSN